jgi:hypothetical protein
VRRNVFASKKIHIVMIWVVLSYCNLMQVSTFRSVTLPQSSALKIEAVVHRKLENHEMVLVLFSSGGFMH